MKRSIIVYGPQGCGKTTNANRLLKKFGLKSILDGWAPKDPVPEWDTLILTNVRLEGRVWRRKFKVIEFNSNWLKGLG